MGQSLPQKIDLSAGSWSACLEVCPAGYPRLRFPGGLITVNGEIALGCPELGYWPIPIVQDKEDRWVPAVPWKPTELDRPGLEWLGDSDIARVPSSRGYRWLNGELPLRTLTYGSEQLPLALRPRRPFAPPSQISPQGDLCEILSRALGRDVRPGSTITCFCHQDSMPTLAVYVDHAYYFSQKKRFGAAEAFRGLGLETYVIQGLSNGETS